MLRTFNYIIVHSFSCFFKFHQNLIFKHMLWKKIFVNLVKVIFYIIKKCFVKNLVLNCQGLLPKNNFFLFHEIKLKK